MLSQARVTKVSARSRRGRALSGQTVPWAPLRGGRRHVLGSRGQKNNSRLFLFVAGVQPLPECGMARCNASIVLRYSFFPGLSIGINYKK
jgi:hypothetical protein